MRNRRQRSAWPTAWFVVLALGGLPGCVERTLQIKSTPPGALVYLNGEESGRTPLRKSFLWYGTYDVQLRKEGYQTLSAEPQVWAPWWQFPPVDLLAEFTPLPLQDNQVLTYKLQPVTEQQTDPQAVLDRAVEMRGKLKSSSHTRQPKTRPSTAPADAKPQAAAE